MFTPERACDDLPDAVTGTDIDRLEMTLDSLIPRLREESGVSRSGSLLNPDAPPSTLVALDVVEFIGRYIAEPKRRQGHPYFQHEHLTFTDSSKFSGRAKFRSDVEQIFARNGIAFTVGEDIRVQRIGPPE